MYTLSRSSSEDQTFPPASAQPGHSPASSSNLGCSRIAIAYPPGGAGTQGPLLHSRRLASGRRREALCPSAVQDSGTPNTQFCNW
jgi:hypothetical protein